MIIQKVFTLMGGHPTPDRLDYDGLIYERVKPFAKIKCQFCQTSFHTGKGTGRRSTSKYCSRKCQLQAYSNALLK